MSISSIWDSSSLYSLVQGAPNVPRGDHQDNQNNEPQHHSTTLVSPPQVVVVALGAGTEGHRLGAQRVGFVKQRLDPLPPLHHLAEIVPHNFRDVLELRLHSPDLGLGASLVVVAYDDVPEHPGHLSAARRGTTPRHCRIATPKLLQELKNKLRASIH
eukprot:CAMPEP_0177337108 /NCGR_PEP_ID=MMETSP0368-20130122/24141_1 /TAXON_ID=447022 ORGANISM="Scrippsiella hangoei-like, Strain SHHI-4" /NCGR_SAMPLE_ID=MMETSP0368 /ASSEMBLY_ACC=CAM_ASM_000363 /LENGTH=157 /DNA_ID=CAMNT_0018798001 /DNA_START=52 /DNA_END=525 /DNA_ORIENTATION=+